jgi:hypothetical protein
MGEELSDSLSLDSERQASAYPDMSAVSHAVRLRDTVCADDRDIKIDGDLIGEECAFVSFL